MCHQSYAETKQTEQCGRPELGIRVLARASGETNEINVTSQETGLRESRETENKQVKNTFCVIYFNIFFLFASL